MAAVEAAPAIGELLAEEKAAIEEDVGQTTAEEEAAQAAFHAQEEGKVPELALKSKEPENALKSKEPENGNESDASKHGSPPKAEEEKNSVSLLKLFSFADGNDLVLLAFGSIAAIAGGVTLPLFNLVMGKLVDGLNSNTSVAQAVQKYVWYLAAVGAGAAVATFIMVLFWTTAGERQAARYKSTYVRALLRQDIAFFDEHPPSELPTLATQSMAKVQDGLGKKAGDTVFYVAMFVGGISVAFYSSVKLAGVMLACMPLMAAGMSVVIMAMAASSKAGQKYYGKAGGVANEVFGAIRTVASLTAEQAEAKRYSDHLVLVEKNGIKEGFMLGAGQGVTFFTFFGSFGLSFWYGSRLVADSVAGNGNTTGGDVLAAIFSILVGAQALGLMQPGINALTLACTAASSLFDVIDRKPAIDSSDPSGDQLESVTGVLEFKDVSFSYPTRIGITVFQSLNITVHKNETLALVGPSGGGKSTITKLLLRFYDPTSGCLTLDGRDIRSLNVRWYRNQIALVSQEPLLFFGTIRDNILKGKPGATEEEVIAAAKAANAHDFISSFPEGYDTQVGHQGLQLSGGQKQRIAISRALMGERVIRVLDEATSALDSESEKVVQKALDELRVKRPCTTVVIAHRLSTIQDADRIAVIAEGGVLEMGTHASLMEVGGMYAALVNSQMSRPVKNKADEASTAAAATSSGGGRDHSSSRALSAIGGAGIAVAPASLAAAFDGADAAGQESGERRSNVLSSIVSRFRTSSAVRSASDQARSGAGVSGATEGGGDAADGKGKAAGAEEEDLKIDSWRLWKMNRPELGYLILGTAGSIVVGSIFPVEGLIIARTQSAYYLSTPDEIRSQGDKWGSVFAGVGVAALVGHLSLALGFATAGEKLVRRIRELGFLAVVRQPIPYFDKEENSVGLLTTRLETDAATVKDATGWALGNKLQLILTLFAGVLISLIYCWQIGLLALALVPLLGVAGAVQSALLTGRYGGNDGLDGGRTAGAVLGGALGGIGTVMAFNMQEDVANTYTEAISGSIESRKRRGVLSAAAFGYSQGAIFLAFALLFYIGGHLIDAGKTTFENFFVALFATILGAIGVGSINSEWGAQERGQKAAQRIFDLSDKPLEVDPMSEEGAKPAGCKGDISFRGIVFAYPSRPDVTVYGGAGSPTGFNLEIKAGQTVALAGPSGGGKSTCIALLLRFYEPSSGSIRVDGRNIKELNVRWLRRQTGLVSQEPVLFMGSVRANILKGKPDATQEEVEAAAKAANAHDFVSAFTDGYDTEVGEKSAMLSGGQKQRIAIARAIISNPKILLLDESTSALDNTSERVVQAALDKLQAKKHTTTIVVAHRLTTIRNSDKIAVVANGGVRELGNHEELLRIPNGVYASLWARQMAMFGTTIAGDA